MEEYCKIGMLFWKFVPKLVKVTILNKVTFINN